MKRTRDYRRYQERKRKKKREKESRKQDRQENSSGGGLENMLAYVDEFGNITEEPTELRTEDKVKVDESKSDKFKQYTI